MNDEKLYNEPYYHVPQSLEEALELLDTYGARAKIIAGGTDVIPKMKAMVLTPDHLISLRHIAGLDFIEYDGEGGLRIGPMATLRKTEANSVVKSLYPALFEGMHSMASTQIRNAGTIIGNICNAVPSADTAPALMVLKAEVRIRSLSGERVVPISDFFTGVCKTVLHPNELVTELHIPKPENGAVMKYYKCSPRRALDLAVVGVATYVVVKNGICEDARIALGAVAITPKLACNAEKILVGEELTPELIDRAAEIAALEDCSPITDMRATKEYRQELVRLSVRDGLLLAV